MRINPHSILFTAVACVAQLMVSPASAIDTDVDGLLDLIDVSGFSTSGRVFDGRGIQDLDGANLLTQNSLRLNSNEITSIESEDFQGQENLQTLRLENNQITSIESGDFEGLTNLRYLYLGGNQITSIEASGFNGLINLHTLELRDNQLTSIEAGDFEGLANLWRLELRDNQLTSIESSDFEGLTNLLELELSANQLTSIESGDFERLTNLRYLYLGGNQITSIEAGGFNGLANLERLYLHGNQLTSIERGDFDGLTNLPVLDLSGNTITSIESGDFEGLTNLRRLELRDNQLTSIESGDFEGLTALRSLGLENNQITIEAGDFEGLTTLLGLRLENNQLTSIESGDFEGLTTLRSLGLEDNQLSELNLAGATLHLREIFAPNGVGEDSFNVAGNFPTIDIDEDEIASLILDDATLSVGSFDDIVGETTSITHVSLVGLNFTDVNPTDLSRLLIGIDSLDTVWVDQALFEVYIDEFNAFDAADGNTVTVVPLGDCNKDGSLSPSDLTCVYTTRSRDAVLDSLNALPGDLDGNGAVAFADFLVLTSNFGTNLTRYADGNINLEGGIDFADYLILSENFGKAITNVAAVPEPSSAAQLLVAMVGLVRNRRRSR